MLIQWNDSNNIGIAIIDEQHKKIISIINSLYKSIQVDDTRKLYEMIRQIEKYTEEHFATEEKLLQDSKYPEYETHKLIHEKLKSRSFTVSRKSMKNLDPVELLIFLKTWWLSHTSKQDRDYVEHVKKYLNKK